MNNLVFYAIDLQLWLPVLGLKLGMKALVRLDTTVQTNISWFFAIVRWVTLLFVADGVVCRK